MKKQLTNNYKHGQAGSLTGLPERDRNQAARRLTLPTLTDTH